MPDKIRANINPDLLTWARESIGMSVSVAAKRLQVSLERLTQWERGEQKPTIKQLQKCSNVYRRPLAAFFFADPPSIPAELHDFRHRPSEMDEEKGYLVQIEIRRARQARKNILELVGRLDEVAESVKIRTRLGANEENVGKRIREYLEIKQSDQASWRDSHRALRAWIEAIESQSVLVLQCSNIPSTMMSGFSVYYPYMPVIVLNGGEAPNGRIFTLLHEFAHLMLRKDGVCDTVEYRGATSSNQTTEMFCNRLAAATLVPEESFKAKFVRHQSGKVENWIDNMLEEAAREYCVSTQVILGRLHDMNVIDSNFYFRKLQEIKSEFTRSQSAKSSAVPAPIYYPITVRNLGYTYTRTVLRAYNGGSLSALDACRYLDIKIKSLPGIERVISGRR